MRCAVIVLSVAALALAAPRDKRLAIGTISVSSTGAGGSTGCVVTGNTLYANGFKLRDLNSTEQQELQTYQTQLEQYKTMRDEVRAVIQEKQKALQNRMKGGRGSSVGNTKPTTPQDLPKPPTKPSFCTAEDTTQYIFDGCMIQSNKVYVGREYARDLSASEIEQLKAFDVEQTVYQKYIQEQVQQQVKGLFGSSDLFSALFSDGTQQQQAEEPSTTRASTSVTAAPPVAPVVPNFCTAIY